MTDIMEISIENLVFDLESLRLPIRIETQEAMLELLLDIGVIQELMLSIGYQGFYVNKPLQAVALDDGKWMVVDGNRRLAALKLLLNPSLCERNSVDKIAEDAIHKPLAVPCMVSLERDAIIESMAFDHVSGPIKWGMLAKARYFTESGDHIAGLAMSTGTRKSYVDRLMGIYCIFQRVVNAEFYGIKGLNEVSLSFPILADILSYENTMDYVAYYEQGLEDVVRWRFETVDGFRRIGSFDHHEDLNKIIGPKKPLSYFKKGVYSPIAGLLQIRRNHETNDEDGAQKSRSD